MKTKLEGLKVLEIAKLRDPQIGPVKSILEGRDTFVVMPTGGGKSLIYQLPAVMWEPRLTVVISPLKALQEDQVSALQKKGVSAAFLNSSMTKADREHVLLNIRTEKLALLYIAPEQLQNSEVRSALERGTIAHLVIDEAHILARDQDSFRKAYSQIGDFLDTLEERPVVSAFTATATADDRHLIINSLHMEDPRLFISTIRRPNLHLAVKVVEPQTKDAKRSALWREKRRMVDRILQDWDGKGSVIVYCSTVKTVKKLSKWLKAEGWKAGKYHGKMPDKKRIATQADFLSGKTKIIVATNAFGLGIDKPNVRLIIHAGLPLSMDGYVQEIGRAGRDGKAAQCVLIYAPSDLAANKATLRHGLNEEQRKAAFKRLDALYDTAGSDKCLWREIEIYFGEKRGKKCGKCCNCKIKKYKKI